MNEFIKGRGAQSNPHNKFFTKEYAILHDEGIDEWENEVIKTTYSLVHPKTLVNKVSSPDVHMAHSANPYQGCEHGCVYCYARESHQYWGLSAGLDFETKILVKKNAPQLFKAFISKPLWNGETISLSGNTDCYQPLERKFKLTRQILEIAAAHRQPISIITKNSLVQRDIDLLTDMARNQTCAVYISINSLTEDTRHKLEPRTATAKQRLQVIEKLATHNIPTGIMCAPIIPGLTDHEIPKVLQAASEHGAKWAGYTIVRLNGQIGTVFKEWLQNAYPDRADKIWNQISNVHGGKVNNSTFGERMSGNGNFAKIIKDTFKLHCIKHNLNKSPMVLTNKHFRQELTTQLQLF